ncbi:MAG: hypothetical protein ACFFCG_07180 [Promethearchaeota archaeon]
MAECDFIITIFDDFIKTRNDENDKILWKTNKILDLMKITNKNDLYGFMENGLRMIMVLFNNYKISPYELGSFDLSEISTDKKEELQFILKTEFI